jgi:hypothetical protein
MTEQQLIELIGQPVQSELRTCGANLGKPWQCKIWSFGTWVSGLTIDLSNSYDGEWRVNSWSVRGS